MAFLTNEPHDSADQGLSVTVPTEQVDPLTNPKILGNTWRWAKNRIMLILFIVAIFALILTHMTPPIIVHPQDLNIPSKHSVSPNGKNRSTGSNARAGGARKPIRPGVPTPTGGTASLGR